jgi:hypothetical protein
MIQRLPVELHSCFVLEEWDLADEEGASRKENNDANP